MKTQHTTSPWRVEAEENNLYYDIVDGDNCLVTTVSSGGGILEMEANAKLIAAAPELLEVLQEALIDLNSNQIETARKRIKEAIQKATL